MLKGSAEVTVIYNMGEIIKQRGLDVVLKELREYLVHTNQREDLVKLLGEEK